MRRVGSLALVVLSTACGKEIVVGSDLAADAQARDATERDATQTKDARADAKTTADDASPNKDSSDDLDAGEEDSGLSPLVVPWTTGFESGNFEDWSEPADAGYCYVFGSNAQPTIVMSPVHSGKYAAAFTIDANGTLPPSQTRCVRQGVLPASAYYGAWFYVPAPVPTASSGWNLLHFQGANSPDASYTNLWDFSLYNQPDGAIAPTVYDFLHTQSLEAGAPIPIASWFHVELRLKRAADTTGTFTVYVNGDMVLDRTGIETDGTNFGQWFVGNYATTLTPNASTVYVDDVSIETTGP